MLLPVQSRDGRRGFVIAGHLDKSKPLASTGIPIANDLCRDDLPMRSEQLLKLRGLDLVAQIPYIKLFAHCQTPLNGKISAPHKMVLRKPI
jgi:hypothetical protein